MKKRRQEAILEIIEKYDLSTQDELLQKLKDSGLDDLLNMLGMDFTDSGVEDVETTEETEGEDAQDAA